MAAKIKKRLLEMVAWKKIMGEFEVGHWMGAKKRGGGNAGYRNFEKGLVTSNGIYSLEPLVVPCEAHAPGRCA